MKNKFDHVKNLLSDGVVYGLVNAFNKGLYFLIFSFVARLLTTEEVGIIGIVVSVASLFTIMAMAGMDSAATRFFFDYQDASQKKNVIASAFWMQLFCFIFVLPAIAFASLAFLSFKQHADTIMVYLGFVVLLNVIHGFGISVARMRRKPMIVVLVSLSNSIVLMIMMFVLISASKKGISGYFYATLAAFAVSSVISLVTLWQRISIRFFNKELSKKMLSYVLPIVPGTIAAWFVENSGILFAGFIGTVESAGIYKVGSTLAQIVLLGVFAFQQAWGPYALSVHQDEGARDFFAFVFKGYLVVMVVLATFLSLFAADILKVFFPPQYATANMIVFLLGFGHVLAGLCYVGVMGLVITKKMKPYGVVSLAMAATTLLGNVVLTNLLGDNGPAWVYFFVKLLTVLAIFTFAQREYRIPYHFRSGAFVFVLGALVSFFGNAALGFASGLQLRIVKLGIFIFFVGMVGLINKSAIIKMRDFVAGKFKN